jgi:hypothetical protein
LLLHIETQGGANLAKVADAASLESPTPGGGESWQKQRGQQQDDGDDDQ